MYKFGYDFDLEISNYDLARKTAAHVKTGNRFLFSDSAEYLHDANEKKQRLQIKSNSTVSVKALIPGTNLSLPGIEIQTEAHYAGHICTVIPDRDLYKAEQDTANILVVYPDCNAIDSAFLRIEFAGEELSSIDIKKSLTENNGMALEAFSMLFAGDYQAAVIINDTQVGEIATFTVAEYQLSPFAASLLDHTLDSMNDKLSFELLVESYDIPWTESVQVILLEADTERQRSTLNAASPGIFTGQFYLTGDGPFKLRVIASKDASRVAEISLPGSGKAQRQLTVISELGEEVNFSMLPTPESIPVRGGFLQHGEKNSVAVQINDCITDQPTLSIKLDTESLSVLCWDILENQWHDYNYEGLASGDEITIKRSSNMMMIFVGAWINQQPFEGYATVFSQEGVTIELESQKLLAPGETVELQIKLSNNNRPLPVYLNIRDSRLTSTNTPQQGLGRCLKEHIEFMAETYADYELTLLTQHDEFDDYSRHRRHAPLYTCQVASSPVISEEIDFDAMESELASAEEISFGGEIEAVYRDKSLRVKKSSKKSPSIPKEDNPEDSRSEFPDSLFCGLVYVKNHDTLNIQLGDSLGTYKIDAFVYDNGNWNSTSHSFVVNQAVRADLDFPPVVQTGDKVYGRVRASVSSGKAKIVLTLNGQPVELPDSINGSKISTPIEFDILVQAGQYQLEVTDLDSLENDKVSTQIFAPGTMKSMSYALKLLQTGESVNLDTSPGILEIEVLPGFDQVQQTLINTTANYAHLCCEQTAAKMLAASAMYISSDDIATQQEAEKIILAGAVREKSMITKKGFIMYPGNDYHSEYYSKLAVQYLWQLQALQQFNGLSSSLKRALQECINYADQAAKFHKMKEVSSNPGSMAEAWALSCDQANHPAITKIITETIELTANKPELKKQADLVQVRTTFAYAAACLLNQGNLKQAIRLANCVMQDINDSGSLYSTVDSVALIAMLSTFKSHDLFKLKTKLRINGKVTDIESHKKTEATIESVEIIAGCALLQITQVVEHNWLSSSQTMKISTQLNNDTQSKFNIGDTVSLKVNLDEGYVNGDLAYINLPAGISRIQGGGRVKQFSVDFAGADNIELPLLVTSKIEGAQHFAVLVRNMFEEDRIACPGLIKIA